MTLQTRCPTVGFVLKSLVSDASCTLRGFHVVLLFSGVVRLCVEGGPLACAGAYISFVHAQVL